MRMHHKTLSLLAFPAAGLDSAFSAPSHLMLSSLKAIVSFLIPPCLLFFCLKKSVLSIILVKHWREQK